MTLSGRELYTKDKELQRYLDSIIKQGFAEIPPAIAKELGSQRIIRDNRENIRIAEDQKFRVSIIAIKSPLKIRKDGDRYFFE